MKMDQRSHLIATHLATAQRLVQGFPHLVEATEVCVARSDEQMSERKAVAARLVLERSLR